MRMGPDERLYVLDSGNLAIRRIDPLGRVVETIAGTGKSGPATDGEPARTAQFGSLPSEQFDGPYGLCVDEAGNLYVADTFNHVIRTINGATGVITTIAGNPEAIPHQPNDPLLKDPRRLNLPKICGLEYFDGRLFVPEWDGDLIVLRKAGR